MSLKLSTGLRNYMLGFGSFRKAFENGFINIYSGSAPATADDAAYGTLLLTITKASGAVTANGANKITLVTVTAANASTTVTLGGVAYNTNAAAATLTVIVLAINLAEVINDTCPLCVAVASGTDGTLYVKSRIDGETFTTAGTLNCSVSDKIAATSYNAITWLDTAVSGSLSKSTDTWSGTVLASGAASYFRLIQYGDDATLSTTQVRLQGTISTSGADMNLSNLNLTIGATTTVDSFAITLPAY